MNINWQSVPSAAPPVAFLGKCHESYCSAHWIPRVYYTCNRCRLRHLQAIPGGMATYLLLCSLDTAVSPVVYSSPLVAKTACSCQNGQDYKKACLFSRLSLRLGHSSRNPTFGFPRSQCTTGARSYTTGGEKEGFWPAGQNLADRSLFSSNRPSRDGLQCRFW